MTDTATQVQYRQELIAQAEQGVSLFRNSVTTFFVIQGNQAIFLTGGTGGAEATSRGPQGLIPSRTDTVTNPACTLQEWHDKVRRTKFNIFTAQGNMRQLMQKGVVKVINRKADDLIIAELANATLQLNSTALPFNLDTISKAQALLGQQDVDIEDEANIFYAITPAARNYLNQIKEFASADYVEVKVLDGPAVKMKRWLGINFFVSNRLPGRTTASETCFLFHRDGIGYAINTGDMEVEGDYNKEESYYWDRASAFMGSKLLLNTHVVKTLHDGSAVASS